MSPDQVRRGGDRELAGEAGPESVGIVSELVADPTSRRVTAGTATDGDPLDGELRVWGGSDGAGVAFVEQDPRGKRRAAEGRPRERTGSCR